MKLDKKQSKKIVLGLMINIPFLLSSCSANENELQNFVKICSVSVFLSPLLALLFSRKSIDEVDAYKMNNYDFNEDEVDYFFLDSDFHQNNNERQR